MLKQFNSTSDPVRGRFVLSVHVGSVYDLAQHLSRPPAPLIRPGRAP